METFEFSSNNKVGPLLYRLQETAFMVSKKNFNLWFARPQKSFPLCLSLFPLSFGPEKVEVFPDHVHIWCLLRMMVLHLHFWMVPQNVFTDGDFWKCFWAHAGISFKESCLFPMLCHLRARRSSNIDFRPCALRTEISPDSLNLLLNSWIVNERTFKVLAVLHWGTLFWNCSEICRCTFCRFLIRYPFFDYKKLCLCIRSLCSLPVTN